MVDVANPANALIFSINESLIDSIRGPTSR
jgi:hypothetical protein